MGGGEIWSKRGDGDSCGRSSDRKRGSMVGEIRMRSTLHNIGEPLHWCSPNERWREREWKRRGGRRNIMPRENGCKELRIERVNTSGVAEIKKKKQAVFLSPCLFSPLPQLLPAL